MIKKCLICDKAFETKNTLAKYCSDKCRNIIAYHKQINKNKQQGLTDSEIICRARNAYAKQNYVCKSTSSASVKCKFVRYSSSSGRWEMVKE